MLPPTRTDTYSPLTIQHIAVRFTDIPPSPPNRTLHSGSLKVALRSHIPPTPLRWSGVRRPLTQHRTPYHGPSERRANSHAGRGHESCARTGSWAAVLSSSDGQPTSKPLGLPIRPE
ncbi:R-LORF3 protein [Gallid alphaherpesvirus 3]|uniref:R-LORF3 protein n=1 Tax=Gallid alphaherpesvirus 3 TaxID=35250 RepID=Q9DHA5_9ALPH|nr:R-LORF3 protein [Gallid alphaherpesvirus 3]YP_010795669.1 R-LORF3 protein [Gallid alphaherpesvirus 3]AEI00190.1 R-LORF3 protein [Gallid alphaherpesvirus 3]AEI00278.1 R-LORF3 protein [Gallid alphaherpesvirus 3]QEY02296.1 R-LORF3 protein [Gallid alphaherpesvirus 3]QEY02297.1 R-LORF3 protein [Gallid alphaherpesvirus 3]BAB16498.1 R-LORF3 protein [Gallid alphaherpesvirus 3]